MTQSQLIALMPASLAQFIPINSPAQCHGLLSTTGQVIILGNVFILLGGREATPDTL